MENIKKEMVCGTSLESLHIRDVTCVQTSGETQEVGRRAESHSEIGKNKMPG